MKSRRILAAVLAPVCAISATAMVASAATDEVDLDISEEDNVTSNGDEIYDGTSDTTSDENSDATSDETSNGDDEAPAESEPAESEPAESEPAESEPAESEPAESKPAESEPVVIEVDIEGVDSEKGVEGDALAEKVLVKDNKKFKWSDVKSVTFTSDKEFSVQFSADKDKAGTDWFIMGKDGKPATLATDAIRDDGDGIWATEWTIGADELALFDTAKTDGGYVKLIGKEGTVDINVSVTMKADATGTDVTTGNNTNNGNTGSENPATGIALAIAPVVLAGISAAVVIGKKRK